MQFIKVKCGRCLATQLRHIFNRRKSLGSKCMSLRDKRQDEQMVKGQDQKDPSRKHVKCEAEQLLE